MILEVIELAYGMEWLVGYLTEHSEEFKHY